MTKRNRAPLDAGPLLDFWGRLGDGLVHPDDRELLRPGDFATDLNPVPWVGPIATADVYLLYLNPGYSPRDLPYERVRPDFVRTLRDNLTGAAPYFYLLDRFADHPGHDWARDTFGRDIDQDDLRRFCVLQLVPYHSKEGYAARRAAPSLPSSKAVRAFVQESVLPAARRGDVALVVARSARLWGVESDEQNPNIVVYRGGDCLGAYVTPKTRGGKLLRQRLERSATTLGEQEDSLASVPDRFEIGRPPARMKAHNAVTWERLAAVIRAGGGTASLTQLVDAALGHQPGTKKDRDLSPHKIAERFVAYCAKQQNSWLVRVR